MFGSLSLDIDIRFTMNDLLKNRTSIMKIYWLNFDFYNWFMGEHISYRV